MNRLKHSTQVSDSLGLGLLLTLSGGFMDAYSYLFRGKVFANAQTGNILLLGINIFEGQWENTIKYLIPIIAFSIGIAIADIVRRKLKERKSIHWRQIAIITEAMILLLVGFLPQELNLVANSLISLVCGLQIESFKKIRGLGAATTMCVGNLRYATEWLCEYAYTKNQDAIEKGWLYLAVILFFVFGAIIGSICIKYLGQYSIFICSMILIVGFISMFYDKEKIMQSKQE
ncbi:MAG: YoaK family protein [Anaerorhabdus sp.]